MAISTESKDAIRKEIAEVDRLIDETKKAIEPIIVKKQQLNAEIDEKQTFLANLRERRRLLASDL